MRELPNLTTTLIVVPDYNRGRQFVRDYINVIEQRDSHNFIGTHSHELTKQIHFRIVYEPNQLRGKEFHDYLLHGQINDHMLYALEEQSNFMKHKYNLGMVE